MVRNSDKLYMLLATFARLGVGMLTFILLARFLGPTAFGILAAAMAYSGLVNLLTDFGFSISALRSASARVEDTGTILCEVLVCKAVLTVLASVIPGLIMLVALPAAAWPIYALAMVGNTANAYADLCMVAARARRRFDIEAVLVITNSVIMTLVVGAVAVLTRNLMWSVLAFAVSRVIYLGVTALALRGWLQPGNLARVGFRQIAQRLKGSAGFAVDGALTNVAGQIDVLIYSALLGPHDMGVYQAGARLVQVISPLAVVLSTVYLPSLSAAAVGRDTAGFERIARRLNIEFAALALTAGALFTFVGPPLTRLVYGHAYDALLPLWGGFGAFALLRLGTAAHGIQLAAQGMVRVRIAAQVASILAFVLLTLVIFPHQGLGIAPLELTLANVVINLIYGVALWRVLEGRRILLMTELALLGGAAGLCLVG